MPSLLKTYSMNSGFKINKPELLEQFYPLPFKDYIVIQNSAGFESKLYSYWQDIVDYIFPILQKQNIQIVIIGDENSQPLEKTYDLRGKTSIKQINYVLRNSKLVISNDSFSVHLAGILDVPIVSVYGPTTVVNHGPYFGEKNKQNLLESHRDGKKPTFSSQEMPKTVDFIKREEILFSIFELLGINHTVKIETLFTGSKYTSRSLEVIPNFTLDPKSISAKNIIIRSDLEFNEDFIFSNVCNFQSSIVTKKQLNLSILNAAKKQISEIVFEIEDGSFVEYLKNLQKIGIKFRLFTKNEDVHSNLNFQYFDISPVHLYKKEEGLDKKEEFIDNNFKTNRFLLSDKKIYLSKAHWKKNIFTDNPQKNIGKVINSVDFWEELEYFWIYNE